MIDRKAFKVHKGTFFIEIFKSKELKAMVEYNMWFFKANWENAFLKNFETNQMSLLWHNGIWKGGVWEGGTWGKGTWKDGVWKSGWIWDPQKEFYKNSDVSPKECKWSLSYGKS